MSSYIAIESQTVGTATATITFNSIPATKNGKNLRDLILIHDNDAINDSDTQRIYYQFNNDETNTYYNVFGLATTTTTVSYSYANGYLTGADNEVFSGNARTITSFQVFDFAQTDKHKSVLIRANHAASLISMAGGRWASTAAITSLKITSGVGQFTVGSTFSLYAIEG